MKTRVEGICDQCGKSLVGYGYEDTHTREDHDFCDYGCMKGFYHGEIPEAEDFLNAATADISSAAAILGRKGGSAKSEAKTKTSAANGRKGGRPKEQPE
jgi:hypothetical protein